MNNCDFPLSHNNPSLFSPLSALISHIFSVSDGVVSALLNDDELGLVNKDIAIDILSRLPVKDFCSA
ncbi:hypothetical protein AKJ16_DCAP13801 [Drosera capensis]